MIESGPWLFCGSHIDDKYGRLFLACTCPDSFDNLPVEDILVASAAPALLDAAETAIAILDGIIAMDSRLSKDIADARRALASAIKCARVQHAGYTGTSILTPMNDGVCSVVTDVEVRGYRLIQIVHKTKDSLITRPMSTIGLFTRQEAISLAIEYSDHDYSYYVIAPTPEETARIAYEMKAKTMAISLAGGVMDRREWLKTVGYLTGSMAFGVATEGSDEDWLVLPGRPDAEFNDLKETQSGSMDRDVQGVEFICYRDGKLNIIRALTQSFADRWSIAHDICMKLKPVKKSHRKLIFRMALYGENTANEKNLQEA